MGKHSTPYRTGIPFAAREHDAGAEHGCCPNECRKRQEHPDTADIHYSEMGDEGYCKIQRGEYGGLVLLKTVHKAAVLNSSLEQLFPDGAEKHAGDGGQPKV